VVPGLSAPGPLVCRKVAYRAVVVRFTAAARVPVVDGDDDLLARLLAEEEELQFDAFTNDTAWELGHALVDAARRDGLSVTVDIRRGEQQLFHYALPGTAADNDAWIERKNRVVRRFGHSTFAMRAAEGDAFAENYLLDPTLFAAHGGAFPVIVRDVGVVGTVTVSGLPQEEDHRLVVSVLRAFLG
jgi:uncharacterized protein (UPF0303 family)